MLGNMEQTVARKQTKREKNNAQKRTEGWKQKGIWLFWYAVVPVFAFYLMECYEHNPFAEVRVGAQLFNIFLFELIGWMLYFLTGRMCFASRVLYGLAVAFGITNHYVMKFRSTPFVPWDLFSAGTAASVAGNYDFTPDRRMVLVTLVFIALFVLTRFFKKGPRFSWKIRLGSIVLVGLVLCTFVNALQQESFQTKHYLYPFLFTPAYMTKVNGMAVTFAMDLAYVAVERPAGYDADEAKETLAKYETKTTETDTQDLPNIIVIMDEAFSDLKVLGPLETNEDYMPFMHRMQQGEKNTVTGYVQTSVCGGNTADSEFEFLTGNTMAFLPNGSIPYQQYIKSRNIPYIQSTSLDEVMPELDILYMTRVQRERFFNEDDYVRLKDSYILTPDKLRTAKWDLAILHPLPRVNEISIAIDDDPRACYFRQVLCGKFIRMALILKLLEVE